MSTPNFALEIEAAAAGEPIEAVVIGSLGYDWEAEAGAPIAWDLARPQLDYTYDNGFGGEGCHAITAWTPSRVIFVEAYDGATSVVWVPRHPAAHWPAYNGIRP